MFHSPSALAQMDALVASAADERVTLYRPGVGTEDDYGAAVPGVPVAVATVDAQRMDGKTSEQTTADRLAAVGTVALRIATAGLSAYPDATWTAVWHTEDRGDVALSVSGVVPETVATASRYADLLCTSTAGVPA